MATQGHINTFTKGMDKDTSYQKYSNMHYEHAQNLRIVTDEEGFSTGAFINIEGNERFVDIPKLISITSNITSPVGGPPIGMGGGQFEVSDTNGTLYDNTYFWPIGDHDFKHTVLNIEADNGLAIPLSLQVENTENNKIYLYSTTNAIDSITKQGSEITATLYDNYYILGSTTVRDSIIIFTCTNGNTEGQIWKIDYTRDTLASSIELVYAGDLNFSKNYLIEAVGRYETTKIQKIYWTDNYNNVKYLNIVDPERFTILPELLNLNSKVTLEPGIFTNIGEVGSGDLNNGTYQVAYRLQTKGGNTTVISPWSVPVSINAASETVEHWNYQRCSHESVFTKAAKTLTFQIEILPEGYDYLQVFLLKRGTSEGILYSVTTITLDNLINFDYTITGLEGEFQEIFKDEIENFNVIIDTAKTLTIKDNRLIIANIKESSQEINYDAEVLRYTRSGATYTDKTNPYNRDSTRDLLSVDAATNKIYHDPANHHKWQKGKRIIGGTGTNISYEFITDKIVLDTLDGTNTANYTNFPLIGQPKTLTNKVLNGKTYNAGNLWNNYRNPYIEHLMAGYQRSEVYRFGILFYDKYSKPLDVKWIGDIRMPEVEDYNIFTRETSGVLSGNVLGVRFDVNIASVKDKISGFSIVRAPRPNKDKTILGQGAINDVVKAKQNLMYVSAEVQNISGSLIITTYNENDIGKQLPGVFPGGRTSVLMPCDRFVRPAQQTTTNRLRNVELYERVVSFDSPQLLNGYGDPQLYGNIIGDETQGIYPQFKSGLKLKPVYGLYAGAGVVKVGTYLPDSSDPNYILHDSSSELVGGMSPIPYYIAKPTNTSLFKNDPAVTAYNSDLTRDPIYSAINIDGAIRVNEFLDNHLVSNYTNTELLALSNTNDKFDYFSIDVNSRTNSNPNTILIGLEGQIGKWYNKAYRTGNSSSPYYYINNTTNHLSTLAGNNKIVANLYRENIGQYGGTTETAITNTTYISTGHYQRVDSDSPNTFTCDIFGGDTYINMYQLTKNYASGRTNTANSAVPDFDDAITDSSLRYMAGIAFPIESTVNIEMIREKSMFDYYPKDEIETRRTDNEYNIYTYDDVEAISTANTIYPFAAGLFQIDPTYKYRLKEDLGAYQAEDYAKIFISVNNDNKISTEFDNRVFASEAKINGERIDSWTTFKLNNQLDVDGHYGPINKLEVFNNTMLFFQDKGFGVIAVNPRSVITDASGAQLELGTGDVLNDFTYVSTNIGSIHQKGIIKTKNGVYFFDANSQKFYRFRGQQEPLSDMKGMSSYFLNNFKHSILTKDNIVIGSGFAMGYDPRYNEVLITYQDSTTTESPGIQSEGATTVTSGSTSTMTFRTDGFYVLGSARIMDLLRGTTDGIEIKTYITGGTSDIEFTNYTITGDYSIKIASSLVSGISNPQLKITITYEVVSKQETLVYSEAIDAFSGFYTFKPKVYIMDGSRFFSYDNDNGIFIHNEGTRCSFYEADPDPSLLRFVVNPKGTWNKVFNNIEYLSQVTESDSTDILNETFNNIKVTNEYQTTEKEIIPYGTDLTTLEQMHARRRIRTWRMNIPRSGTEKARIRNPYTTIELTYNNNDDKKLLLNDIITYYMDVPM